MSASDDFDQEGPVPGGSVPELLVGQRALVTGASSGIGRCIALAYARAGADVAVNHSSSEEAAHEVADAIAEMGCDQIVHQADVSDVEEVRKMFDRVCDAFGSIDILVNNAGIQKDAPLTEMSVEQWQQVLDVNLTGQFLCAREAVREFRCRGIEETRSCAAGKIICISSVHQRIPWANRVNYAASKGGVKLMMESIAQETAGERIRVNAIAPGAIRTRLNRDVWERDEAYAELLEMIPYERIGEVEDVGRVAVWLASDQADYLNGETIFVDGGMSLYPAFRQGG